MLTVGLHCASNDTHETLNDYLWQNYENKDFNTVYWKSNSNTGRNIKYNKPTMAHNIYKWRANMEISIKRMRKSDFVDDNLAMIL